MHEGQYGEPIAVLLYGGVPLYLIVIVVLVKLGLLFGTLLQLLNKVDKPD